MDQSISAAEANRNFSMLLRSVRDGQSYVVTSHGKPIARIIPADEPDTAAEGARLALLTRLRNQPAIEAGPWTRDELYEDDEA
jgi:prevent-host-death family protein